VLSDCCCIKLIKNKAKEPQSIKAEQAKLPYHASGLLKNNPIALASQQIEIMTTA
jgi:hypothetical protein